MTIPFDGIPLAEHREWFEELVALGYTDVWSSEADGTDGFTPLALAAAFVMTASLMVSYTRARAEALIGTCKVGFMERPERIVCVILGALCNRWGVMAAALWVLAVMSTITVLGDRY